MSDVAERVKKIVVEHLGVDESKVTENDDAQMLDDDLLDPIVDVTHPFFSPLECLRVGSAKVPGTTRRHGAATGRRTKGRRHITRFQRPCQFS